MTIDTEKRRLLDVAQTAIAELAADQPTAPRVLHLWHSARRRAEDLRTAVQRHITVGFAGDVNKGKSLLISLLAGQPDLLTVADAPATGNLTRVVLQPVRSTAQAGRLDTAVCYMTPEGVVELVEFILDRIREHAGRSGRYGVAALDYHPVSAEHPDRADWSPLEHFFRAWWPEPTLNLKLREWATELFNLRDALQIGSALLARTRGQRTPISGGLLDDAVKIGTSHTPSPDFPEPVYAAPCAPGKLTADTLKATRHLIDEVVITVGVPPQVLDLGGVIEFLDFPGLDSGSLRDRFLIQRELPRTTIAAVVVDGREPTSDSVKEFFSMLENGRNVYGELDNSMLVIGNKFDGVEPPYPPARDTADLAARSDNIEALLGVVGELTRQRYERFVLVSALRAGERLGTPPPRGATVHDMRVARDSGARWEPTVRALLAGDRGGALTVPLRHFTADDGGLAHLGDVLARHIHEHGERIWLAEVLALEELYLQARRELDDARPVRVPLSTTQARLARTQELVRRLRSAADRLKPLLHRLILAPHIGPPGERFDDLIERETALAVLTTLAWEQTLSRAGSGLIRLDSTGGAAVDWPIEDPEFFSDEDDGSTWHGSTSAGSTSDGAAVGVRAPLTTGDLSESYEAAASALVREIDLKFMGLMRTWSGQLYHDLNMARDADLLAEGAADLQDMLTALVGAHLAAGYVRNFKLFVDPAFVTGRLERGLAKRPAAEMAYGFPMSVSSPVPWHPQIGDPGRKDPAAMFRLRRDVVEALEHQLRARLQETLMEVYVTLTRMLDQIGRNLPDAAAMRRAAADAGDPASTPQSTATSQSTSASQGGSR